MDNLQQLVLSALDSSSIIQDTRLLNLPKEFGSSGAQEAQLALQGALNSLQSKDVGFCQTLFLSLDRIL